MCWKCNWNRFIRSMGKKMARKLGFGIEYYANLDCDDGADMYIGIKRTAAMKIENVDNSKDDVAIIQGVGGTFCKFHAARVLTIINRYNAKRNVPLKDDDIEILPL